MDESAAIEVRRDDALMGEQLTTQYRRAVGGLMEVLRFGAMMIELRGVLSARGQNSALCPTRGPTAKGTGLDSWLSAHAPSISRPTAYRFLSLAEGLREEFRLGVRCDLVRLLSAPLEELEPAQAKRRARIEEFLEGKSQRQLLFDFGIEHPRPRGGRQEPVAMDPADRADRWARESRESAVAIFRDLELLMRSDRWRVLSDAELDGAIERAEDALAQLRAWRATPKRDRSIPELQRQYSALPPGRAPLP